MARRALMLLAVAAACALVGCGGTSKKLLPSDTLSTQAAQPSSTTSTAVYTASTAPSTTSSPATSQTPTTLAESVVRVQVADGFDASRRAYNAALADPANFDRATIEATYAAGPMRDEVIGNITKFAAQGWRTKPGPAGLEYAVVEDIAFPDGVSGARASIVVCDVSDSIVYDPVTDAIVNNTLESRRIRWAMVLDGGQWKRQAVVDKLLDETGVNRCPPPPA